MAKDTPSGKPQRHDADRRSYVTQPLSRLVPGLTRAAYRKRSPAGALLMSDWALIVGETLAAQTEPRRLSGTQLTIACSGPMAMELQHVSTSLIERINVQAGRRIVERLRFVQDLAARPAPPPRRQVSPVRVDGIEDGPLNEALAGLRAAMSSRSPR